MLSPLRFHYDSDTFNLPIRLGLINSGGTQDLVVTVLARNQRYEVANYDNVTIPTNIDVSDATRRSSARSTRRSSTRPWSKHPRAVVTEYSWAVELLRPLPDAAARAGELATLGADVLPRWRRSLRPGGGAPIVRRDPSVGHDERLRRHAPPRALLEGLARRRPRLPRRAAHRRGPRVSAGRQKLEQGARADSSNNFQARYVIRHPWTGPSGCTSADLLAGWPGHR